MAISDKFPKRFFQVIATLLASFYIPFSGAYGIPIEKFDQKVEVTCSSSATCARSLRSKTTLGAYAGIVLHSGPTTTSSFTVKDGSFEFKGSGAPLGNLIFTWDGDTYPDQLSSSGLNCFNLRMDGGSAFVLENFSVQGMCGDGQHSDTCAPFIIETRIYDAADPTGQVYSASILRRLNVKGGQDLIIPFSNFNRKGPRGKGRLECAGAISLRINMSEYSTVNLSLGPIFTNSLRPLEFPAPTPTQVSLVPSETPSAVTVSVITPMATIMVAPTATVAGEAQHSILQAAETVSSQRTLLGDVGIVPLPQERSKRSSRPTRGPEEEVVYGDFIRK